MDIANKLESVVSNYLEGATSSSALLITGKWGSGKTYFFKKKVIPLISNNDLIPVYVSLNGIDSQEKLKKTIYSTLTTTVLLGEIKDDKDLKNVAKKRVKKIMENAQQIVGKIKTDFGDIGQFFKYLNIFEFEDFIVLDDVVFCLDDLERISDDFRIEDLLGFINSEFIEHKNLKVILIGNETKRQLSSCPLPLSRHRMKVETIFENLKFIRRIISNRAMRSDGIINMPPILNFFIQNFHGFKPFQIQTFSS